MLSIAADIQAPSPSVLGELRVLIESGSLVSGPAMVFDRERGVFLVAVVEQSQIVHWQLESCRDDIEALSLTQRYRAQLAEAVRQLSPDLGTVGGKQRAPS